MEIKELFKLGFQMVKKLKRKLRTLKERLLLSAIGGGSLPVFPLTDGTGLRIHLGAGPINLQGWINVDARSDSHIHLKSEGFGLSEFSNDGVSEIYMCHVLEHFSFEETKEVLETFREKLKRGGVLRLSVPDFDRMVEAYHANGNDIETVKFALMGGQDYVYNYHKSVYNHDLLCNLLVECGFGQPTVWTTEVDFGVDLGDWSNKGFDTPNGFVPVSLNIKAMKQ